MAGTYFAGASGATAGLANALNAGITAGSALGGGGSLAALTPGIFAKAAPALGGLQSLAPTLATKAGPGLFNTMGMNPLAGMQSVLPSASPTLASGAYNPAYAEMLGKQFAANSFPAGSPDVARTLLASTDKVAPMAFKPPPSAQFLNTFQEGAALPGVTSGATAPTAAFPSGYSLPPQTFGNVAGGPAIPKVTSSLPVSTTQTGLMPPSIPPTVDPSKGFLSNALSLAKNPSMQGAADYIETHPYASAGAAYGLYNLLKPKPKQPQKDVSLIRPYDFTRTQNPEAYAVSPTGDSSERDYFTETFTPLEPYEAPGPEYKKAAEGGLMGLAVGGPVETMSAMNAIGGNMMYPQSQLQTPMYSNPMMQRPEATNVISPSGDAGVGAYSGEQKFAAGGLSDLGGYSDGGRLLKGPGDGVSDSIPAVIGERQPARLADGEFVVPARIVSELGNGSTEAGARKLYAMMDRVQKARRKTVGKNRVATNTRAEKHLPA
jgi:hypothetical protein